MSYDQSNEIRRESFCRHYLTTCNATEAARRAGFSEASAAQRGYELLKEEAIQQRIAELADERDKRVEVEADDILRELMRIALADPADAFNPDGSLKSIHEIPVPLRRTISGIKTIEAPGGAEVKEIKFWNKERGLEMLARHLSLFRDVLTLRDDAAELNENEVSARMASLVELLRKRLRDAEGLV